MYNDLKAGGKLVIINGDPHQLMCTTGYISCLSNNLAFQFDVVLLHHYVRKASDPFVQKIIQLLKK